MTSDTRKLPSGADDAANIPDRIVERLLLSLSALILGVAMVLVGWYKLPGVGVHALNSKGGAVLCLGVAIAVIGIARLTAIWLREKYVLRPFSIAIAFVAISGVFMGVGAELVARGFMHKTSDGILIGNVTLRPAWTEVRARMQGVIKDKTPTGSWSESFIIPHELMGWTIGSNRRSSNGLYFSSVEGIRADQPDISYQYCRQLPTIVLIGDSYTFSSEVGFADSWGYFLQQRMGDDICVLNFGVGGFGLDQMFLRFIEEAEGWQPDVVLLSLIQHDFLRTMRTYVFSSNPSWNLPFASPRYVLKPNNEIGLLTERLPSPRTIFSAADVSDLPFIDFDWGYATTDWTWRSAEWPVSLRFLMSLSPKWKTAKHPNTLEDARRLNARLLTEFARRAKRGGSEFLTVLLPSGSSDNEFAHSVFAGAAGFVYADLSACITKEDKSSTALRVPSGIHFSGVGNAIVADCTAPLVVSALNRATSEI